MPNAQGNTRTFRPPVIIQKFPVFIYMRQVRGNFQYVNVRKLHPNVRKKRGYLQVLYEKMMPFFCRNQHIGNARIGHLRYALPSSSRRAARRGANKGTQSQEHAIFTCMPGLHPAQAPLRKHSRMPVHHPDPALPRECLPNAK